MDLYEYAINYVYLCDIFWAWFCSVCRHFSEYNSVVFLCQNLYECYHWCLYVCDISWILFCFLCIDIFLCIILLCFVFLGVLLSNKNLDRRWTVTVFSRTPLQLVKRWEAQLPLLIRRSLSFALSHDESGSCRMCLCDNWDFISSNYYNQSFAF